MTQPREDKVVEIRTRGARGDQECLSSRGSPALGGGPSSPYASLVVVDRDPETFDARQEGEALNTAG
jgi:hypothetical protein